MQLACKVSLESAHTTEHLQEAYHRLGPECQVRPIAYAAVSNKCIGLARPCRVDQLPHLQPFPGTLSCAFPV